jgi:hypothetical protein
MPGIEDLPGSIRRNWPEESKILYRSKDGKTQNVLDAPVSSTGQALE